MSTHKHIDKLCFAAIALTLIVTVLFMNGAALGIEAAARVIGYENRLFDASRVHTIDIVMDDWDSFIETCENEEYSVCSAVIDGEVYKNIGIRAKGNTSLSNVSSMNSDRYSFKIEFDQYDSTKSYHGLDKLSLNNIIQDNTFMKDYLVYRMMYEFGAAAPLCSFAYITVNGEDWGLYLAVEAVEDSFLQRNYGSDHGELYKPDSMSFGGGRGNGRDFSMSDFEFDFNGNETGDTAEEITVPSRGGFTMPDDFDPSAAMPGDGNNTEGGFAMPENFDPSSVDMAEIEEFIGNMGGNRGGMGGFGGGMGSSDVKLQYIDDDPDSYSNIFSSAKTDYTEADAARLINSLKILSEGENIESAVDVENVIRYFVVHNFVVNGDSYTGTMIHNYYLYEEDGKMSMLPWDYNLAYGTFQGSNASSAVNDPIDSPVSGDMSDRPMVAWIFNDEAYTELYHTYFEEFINQFFENGYLESVIDETYELIKPYVEKDPSKFCTFEEFETGAAAIKEFCLKRAESVSGQLDGSIPSTSEGQSADSSTLVDTTGLNISDMGTMNNGIGGGRGGNMFGEDRGNSNGGMTRPNRGGESSMPDTAESGAGTTQTSFIPTADTQTDGRGMPSGDMGFGGMQGDNMQGGNVPPGMPEGGSIPSGIPENFDPAAMIPNETVVPADTAEVSDNTDSTDTAQSDRQNTFPQRGDMSQSENQGGFNGRGEVQNNMQVPDLGNMSGQTQGLPANTASTWIMLGVCALVLIVGIIVAWWYRR
ncbi:MAG: CotH kinase family protein [Clostridia bacterium]|nr:CotH kinase family protein [Clostridia bacterium]